VDIHASVRHGLPLGKRELDGAGQASAGWPARTA